MTESLHASVAEVTRRGKRRRPTGSARRIAADIDRTARLWLGVVVALALGYLLVASVGPLRLAILDTERDFLVMLAGHRGAPLDGLAEGFARLGTSPWTIRILTWGTFVVLAVFRRWRHLLTGVLALLVAETVTDLIILAVQRLRPVEVEFLFRWAGWSHPSQPVQALAAVLTFVGYSLLPRGRTRRLFFLAATALVVIVSSATWWLGIDHPTDDIAGALIGSACVVLAFRWLCPESSFPVTYGRRAGAHLDIGGRRGEAIEQGLREQLGLEVLSMEPFGEEGSAGSTPFRVRVAVEDGETWLFAKLNAKSHLRSDRWYKLARTIMYGRLEDESRFSTVRRLIEREDYLLRVFRDSGIPGAEPIGIVEVEPESEYVIVTSFLEGGRELTDMTLDVTDSVIDSGLGAVRSMWDAGLAHRDVKPSNVLVRRQQVHLIDVAFGQIRPTPWRQAVDLANMMLVMGLRAGTERTYARARLLFNPEEIAEAFAATKGVTIPSQTRRELDALARETGRDLVAEFRGLAPARSPIAIQRWSLRRVLLALGVVTGSLLLIGLVLNQVFARQTPVATGFERGLACDANSRVVLMAQAFPEADSLPCFDSLPAGWHVAGVFAETGRGEFDLWDGQTLVARISLTPSCESVPVRTPEEVDSAGTQVDRQGSLTTTQLGPDARLTGRFVYSVPGACVVEDVDLTDRSPVVRDAEAFIEEGLDFVTRAALDAETESRSFSFSLHP